MTDSPLGPLLAARTPRGLVRLAYLEAGDEDEVLGALAARVSPRLLEDPGALDDVRRELDAYFDGRARGFTIPIIARTRIAIGSSNMSPRPRITVIRKPK